MASRKAVMAALTLLGRAFAGTVDGAKADVYAAALEDVTDEALLAATVRLTKTHGGEFIPTPPQIREAAGVNTTPVIDVEGLLRQIDKAGSYNPNSGWNPPRVETVRTVFGEAVAEAYGAAGGASRLFAANETTREIAARDFAKALEAAQTGRHLLPPHERTKALSGRTHPFVEQT